MKHWEKELKYRWKYQDPETLSTLTTVIDENNAYLFAKTEHAVEMFRATDAHKLLKALRAAVAALEALVEYDQKGDPKDAA